MRQADNDDVFQQDVPSSETESSDVLAQEYPDDAASVQVVPGERKIRLGQRYAPFSFTLVHRTPKYPLLIDGELRESYVAPEVKEYVDTHTGEILLVKDVPKGKLPPTNRYGEMCLQRRAVLHGLRPEVRAFAYFVLQFRDQRGGMTPGMDKLVRWYAELEGKRVPDVRRYVARLEETGVCEGDCMGPRFMWFERKPLYSHYLGAAPLAEAKFYFMKLRRAQDDEAQRRRDNELVDQECSKTVELQRLSA